MEYPKQHKQIVDELLGGKFILAAEPHFEEVKENDKFYSEFFRLSFDYEFILTQKHAYLLSKESNENLSRDISIFLGILCYELDKQGKNFIDSLEYAEFSMEEIDLLFDNSSFADVIKLNNQLKDSDKRRIFLNQLNRKNIIVRVNEERFYFSSAYHVFIEFAKELGRS
jgi:hypothetical protein